MFNWSLSTVLAAQSTSVSSADTSPTSMSPSPSPSPALGPPVNLTAEALTSTAVNVSWMEPATQTDSISEYLVQYAITSSNATMNTMTTNATIVILTDLTPFTMYTITVMAVGGVVMGEAATVIVVTLEAGQYTVLLIEHYLLRLQYYIAT